MSSVAIYIRGQPPTTVNSFQLDQQVGANVTTAGATSSSRSRSLRPPDCYWDSLSENYITRIVDLLGMAECQNCGAIVTEQYVRVFAPAGMETVRVCPECPDMVREGGDVREAKAPRQQS